MIEATKGTLGFAPVVPLHCKQVSMLHTLCLMSLLCDYHSFLLMLSEVLSK